MMIIIGCGKRGKLLPFFLAYSVIPLLPRFIHIAIHSPLWSSLPLLQGISVSSSPNLSTACA